MNRVALICTFLLTALLIASAGCPSIQSPGFGPFPVGSLAGGTLAGVAGFAPGNVPGVGEFKLTIVNLDNTRTYNVSATPAGGTATTGQVLPCNVQNIVTSCDATSVDVTVTDASSTLTGSLAVVPPSDCSQLLVYISVTTIPAEEGGTPTTSVVVTDTFPSTPSACGFAL